LFRVQQFGELDRVRQIAADEFLEIGVPREVDFLVPIPECAGVLFDERRLLRRQIDLVAGEGSGEGIRGFRWLLSFCGGGFGRFHGLHLTRREPKISAVALDIYWPTS